MISVKFTYDENTSLTVIINEGWLFSLENDDPFMNLVVNSNGHGNGNGGK